ncbi:MAG: aldo/keto reductase [Chloroflexi bacterium]|nr:aldo/keto reductase [Chloroflexota bacterium]
MIPRRPLGSTGLTVSVLGFGGASIGFAEAAPGATFVPLVRRALDLGVTFFDTAPDYRRSEALLGEALRSRRSEVVLATKCGRLQNWNGTSWDVEEDWSEVGVLGTIERSLRRLATDYLDLVQLHSPPDWVLEDGGAIGGLQRAKASGKVRHIGVSADGEIARRALALGVFETLQISCSILQQEPGDHLIPEAVARGVGVIAKQPIANGIPTMSQRPTHPDWSWKWAVARQLDWTGADEVGGRLALALRWLLANTQISTAIVGTTRLENLEANVAAALGPPLEAGQVQRIHDEYVSARRVGEGQPR